MSTATGNTLNIDTLIVRPTFAVDGVDYEMRAAAELGLLDQAKVQHHSKVAAGIDKAGGVKTDRDATLIRQGLDTLLSVIWPDAPEPVLAKLTDRHKTQIIEWWLGHEGLIKESGGAAEGE